MGRPYVRSLCKSNLILSRAGPARVEEYGSEARFHLSEACSNRGRYLRRSCQPTRASGFASVEAK
jgi:hypothetical protein